MSFLSRLLTHAVAWLVQGLHAFVVLFGHILLGVQHALNWLDSAHPLATLARPLTGFVQRYPRRIAAVLASVLMAAGGGAFALANLGPDAAELPVVQLSEPIHVAGLEAQARALDSRELKLLRSDTTRNADTPESLLKRLGLVDPEAVRFLHQNAQARDALAQAGRSVKVEATQAHQLSQLTVRWLRSDSDTQFQRWVLTRSTQGLSARLETVPMTSSIRMSGGTVSSSIYAASDEARLPDAVIGQLADIFSSQIDFHKTLLKGTRFAVVYEVLEADGEPLRTGKVLSAEFVYGDKTYEALWFQELGQKGSYYAFDGSSLRRAYLASPVPFSRKTSGVSMRLHPIFQTRQAHRGIDYAAPRGTPAHSVGDGVVEFAGVQTGFGNVVIVNHGNNHSTLYAHLSRIHVRKGQTITQGQAIGAVGSTGWSTGPHLHFEFRVNGVHVDPQTVIQKALTTPISASARAAFKSTAQTSRAQLMAAAQMRESAPQ